MKTKLECKICFYFSMLMTIVTLIIMSANDYQTI